MKFRTDGLIIKEQNIGENDRLVFALTKSNGVIRAFVKGAKNIKNQKCAATSLLSYSRLTIYKGRESYIIGEAQSIKIFSKLRYDVKKMCLAQYFCELALTVVCPREQNSEPFLKLVLNSLYLLSEGKRSAELIKPCLEMRLVSLAGYMPDLTMCRNCGEYSADTMYFLPEIGMLECASCHERMSGGIALSPSALTALRHTIYADDDKLFSFSLSQEGLELLNICSESYLKYKFEKDFKTLNFYKAIS